MSKSWLRNKHMRKHWTGESSFIARQGRSIKNKHRQDEAPKNSPSRYIMERISVTKVSWLQESTSFGGHSIPKGGHRKVSGIVRAKVREEVRDIINNSINDSK